MNLPDHHVTRHTEEEMLRAEIRRFEAHLANIANEDDCAYGKARIRAFEALLQEHRSRLHDLVTRLDR